MAAYYTVKQTSKILGFSTNSIYTFLEDGRLKGHRGNSELGRFKISHSSLEKFIGAPLSEEAVAVALENLGQSSMQVKKEFTIPDSPSSINQTLPLKVTRPLIIAGLLFLLLDLVITQDFSFTDQILRLIIMGILITLTYQFGGLQGGNHAS